MMTPYDTSDPKNTIDEKSAVPNSSKTRIPSRQEAEQAIDVLLRWIGEDPSREGLAGTPSRVVRAWTEFCSGYQENPAHLLKRTFEEVEGYDDMVMLRNIRLQSHCEHHLVPILGVAHIAYVPDRRVVGISKLARIVEVFSRRLQNQERITKGIADDLEEHLQPLGSAVILEASHGCMRCRGVRKQNSVMTTSAMRGVFFDKPEPRQELMQLIQSRPL